MTVRVVLLCKYPLDTPVGGVQTYSRQLGKRLAMMRDVEVHAVTLDEKPGTYSIDDVTVHALPPHRFPWNINRLMKAVELLEPDVIHVHGSMAPYAMAAARLAKKHPVVLTVLGIVEREVAYKKGASYLIERHINKPTETHALKRIRNVIAISPYVRDFILEKSKASVRVIPIGVDETFYKARKKNGSHILYAGAITRRKGLLDLVKAYGLAMKKHPRIRLVVAGSVEQQDYYDEIRDYMGEHGLGSKITFNGHMTGKNLVKLYEDAIAFVLPSHEESQGIVLAEAQAVGTPVVVSDIGGVKSVVADGRTGLMFPPGDHVKLAQRLQELLDDPKLRARLAKGGRKNAERFRWEKIAEDTAEVYRQAIRVR